VLFTKQRSTKNNEKYMCGVATPLYELRVNINIFSIQIPKNGWWRWGVTFHGDNSGLLILRIRIRNTKYERMNDRMNVSMAQNDLYSILNSDINVLLSIHEK